MKKFKFCTTCKSFRTEGTVHCARCDKCIFKFDHHCLWLDNCIGGGNYKIFIFYSLFLLLDFLFKIFVFGFLISKSAKNHLNAFFMFNGIFALIAAGFMSWLIFFHSMLFFKNLTTYEYIKQQRLANKITNIRKLESRIVKRN